MASITIDLSDSQLQKLRDLARVHGIALEVLLKASLEDWLNSQRSEFVDAANYVLTKNAELYRRLA
ncbi:MAG: DNA-binding protein [Coleofasciculus sp. G3-WIS-01]|uniref:DNA-binding protein n=1 Tax=Coleofasciculus sp. G3-WIS-01 TaxID=3069528 RepID=UPI0032F13970